MDDSPHTCSLEFGRIVFQSWEHSWSVGVPYQKTGIVKAHRVLPTAATQPVYEWLCGLEAMLLRRTMPFPPFDVRVGRVGNILLDGDGLIWGQLPIRCLCPAWDHDLRAVDLMEGDKGRTKSGKHGTQISVPTGDTLLGHAYQLNWEPLPGDYALHDVLREFSPLYKEKTIFDALEEHWNSQADRRMEAGSAAPDTP